MKWKTKAGAEKTDAVGGASDQAPASADRIPQREKSSLRETVELVVLALVLALALRTLVIQAFRIPSGSMEDTLLVGDFILVNKLTYGPYVDLGIVEGRLPGFRKPHTGDVAVFKYPLDPSKDFIKRLIAGPGQTVRIEDRDLYVDGVLYPDPPHAKHIDPRILPRAYSNRDNFGPITVPKDSYFFMGDNRENSKDGREWGFVPARNIKGKAFLIYLSWDTDPTIPWFNLFKKIRWGRLFHRVR